MFNPKIYWIDLETTGLNPVTDSILEIAVAESNFTDPFNYKHVYHAVLSFDLFEHPHVNPFVKELHTKNGLWKECKKSKTTIFQVDLDLIDIIEEPIDKENQEIIGGSVVHFDRSFLFNPTIMPNLFLSQKISHRNYDVTAIKLFCYSLGMPRIEKKEAHRAKLDIEESISHAKQCFEWLKRDPNGTSEIKT